MKNEVKTPASEPTASVNTAPSDVDVLLAQNIELSERLSKVEVLLKSPPIVVDTPKAPEGTGQTEGLTAVSYGTLYCPECHLMLDAVNPSGLANAFDDVPKLYVHPFTASRRLENKQCRWKGKQFKPPRVFMEVLPEVKKATKV